VQLSPAIRLDIHRGVLKHVADSLMVRVSHREKDTLFCSKLSTDVPNGPRAIPYKREWTCVLRHRCELYEITSGGRRIGRCTRSIRRAFTGMYDILRRHPVTKSKQYYQVVALLQSPSPKDFLDNDLREMAYSAVRPKDLQLVLVKLITYWNSLEPSSPLVDPRRKRAMVGFPSLYDMRPLRRLTAVAKGGVVEVPVEMSAGLLFGARGQACRKYLRPPQLTITATRVAGTSRGIRYL
jgi:hypothetical protein